MPAPCQPIGTGVLCLGYGLDQCTVPADAIKHGHDQIGVRGRWYSSKGSPGGEFVRQIHNFGSGMKGSRRSRNGLEKWAGLD